MGRITLVFILIFGILFSRLSVRASAESSTGVADYESSTEVANYESSTEVADYESSTEVVDYTWTQELPSVENLEYEKWNGVIQTVSRAMQGTVGLATIITNGFALYCFIKHDFIQTRTNVYILSLCVSDLLIGFSFCFTPMMNQFFKYYAEAAIPCVASTVMRLILGTTSAFSIMASALERYVFVAHPYTHIRYEDSNIHVVMVIILVWILPVALCAGVLPLNNIWSPPNDCLGLHVVQGWKNLAFGVPVVIACPAVVCWACIKILLLVRRHRRDIAAMQPPNIPMSQPSDVMSPVSDIPIKNISIEKPRDPNQSNQNSQMSGPSALISPDKSIQDGGILVLTAPDVNGTVNDTESQDITDVSQPKVSSTDRTILPGVSSTLDTIQSGASSTLDTIQLGASSTLDTIKPGASSILDTIQSEDSSALDTTQPVVSSTLGTIQPGASSTVDTKQPRISSIQDTMQPGHREGPGTSTETGSARRRQNCRAVDYDYDPQKKQRKRIRMLLAIALMMVITWTPLLIITGVRAVIERPENLVYSVFAEMVQLVFDLNCFINPLLYHRLSPDIDRAYIGALCRRRWIC